MGSVAFYDAGIRKELCDPKTADSAPLAQAFTKFQKALAAYTDQKIAA